MQTKSVLIGSALMVLALAMVGPTEAAAGRDHGTAPDDVLLGTRRFTFDWWRSNFGSGIRR